MLIINNSLQATMSNQTRFSDNGDGTVTDTQNGLMWIKTDTMNDLGKWVNYIDSQDYVRALNEKKFAGYEDWRLPCRDELSTFYDESLKNSHKRMFCAGRRFVHDRPVDQWKTANLGFKSQGRSVYTARRVMGIFRVRTRCSFSY